MRNLEPKPDILNHMRIFVGGLAVIGALAIGAALLPAQQDAAAPSDGAATFKSEVRNVQVPVVVLDRDGSIVNGLNATNFTVLDNGKPQKITEDLSSHPISLVVAVQANHGMEGFLPKINKIGSLFDSLVLGEDGEMAVIAFDHRIQTLTNFTSDPDKIHAAFSKDKLKAGSLTSALNDAEMEGINMLRNRDPRRKRILMTIAEDRDQGSGLKVRDVLEAAEFNNIEMYSVDVSQLLAQITSTATPTRPDPIPPGGRYLPNGQVMTPTLDQQLNNNGDWTPVLKDIFLAVKGIIVPNPLDIYSRYTGARQFPFHDQKGLEKAISEIGEDLHNEYLLTYEPNDQNEAGYHTIKVIVDRPGLKIYAREGYWALATKPE